MVALAWPFVAALAACLAFAVAWRAVASGHAKFATVETLNERCGNLAHALSKAEEVVGLLLERVERLEARHTAEAQDRSKPLGLRRGG